MGVIGFFELFNISEGISYNPLVMHPAHDAGIPAIKIDISFRADSCPPQGGAFSAHTGKVIPDL